MKKNPSILFIGNSYTYYNDMPTAIFEKIARAAGYDITVNSITKGGWSLEQHANPDEEFCGVRVDAALKKDAPVKYDFVILQEQSLRPARDDAAHRFHTAVRYLSERIKETGATPLLYSTWGRKEGSPNLDEFGWTNESMTWRLAASYLAAANELDIPVAHVGLAFFDVYRAHPEIELYHKDKSHPSYAGSFLAALTIFTKIFGENVNKSDFCGELDEATVKILRDAAISAVFNTPTIPQEYRISTK